MVSIAVCEQHEMVREALVKAMAPMDGVTVLVAENDGNSFVEAVREHKPEVMVVDISHPRGAGDEIARRAKASHRSGKLVTLVDEEGDESLVQSFDLGASAVIGKERPVRELHKTVLDVAASRRSIDPKDAEEARKRISERSEHSLFRLNETDRKMLELLTRGYTDRQIASEVFLSLQTVRNRMSRLLQSFHLDNRTQLALHVDRLGIFGERNSNSPLAVQRS